MMQEISKYYHEFIKFTKDVSELAQDDWTVTLILLCLFALILVGFVWMIQTLLSVGSKKRNITPYDAERVDKYNEDLSGIVGEGRALVEILENEIRDGQHRVVSLREEVDALREEHTNLKEEIRLMEEAPTELADSLKRDSEQKVKIAGKKGNRKAFKMMVLGLFLGFLVTSVTSGFLLYKSEPNMVQTKISNLQSYASNLWNDTFK